MRKGFSAGGALLAISLFVAACGSSSKSTSPGTSAPSAIAGSAQNKASAPGITSTTITIGYIAPLTGAASSSFSDGTDGAAARIALQNAEGGVDGRKIQLVAKDDQSSTATNKTASEELINQNVFGVIDYSSFAFAGARALQQGGVPVTGWGIDGPEWGQQPYSNMFSFLPPFLTPYNGVSYLWDYDGKFLKDLGVTKLGGMAYGESPASVSALKGLLKAANGYGISTCYENTSVPFGSVDFTAAALALKSAGCNGVTSQAVDASDIALSQAVKNAGMSPTQLYQTGYDEAVLSNKGASASLDGAYVANAVNFSEPNGPTQAMLNTLKKYDSHFSEGIPDFGLWGSYLAADLMIKGLQLDGQNPTRQSFITNLRQVSDYDAGGILPSPTPFTNFGTKEMLPHTNCTYFFQLKNPSGYVGYDGGKPFCGRLIAGS